MRIGDNMRYMRWHHVNLELFWYFSAWDRDLNDFNGMTGQGYGQQALPRRCRGLCSPSVWPASQLSNCRTPRDLKKPPEGCDMWLPRQACRKWQAFSERVSGVWRGIFKEFFQCNAHIEVNASRSSGIQAIDWQIDSVSPSAESDWLTAWLLHWMISGYCSSSSERRAPLLALDLLGSWLLPSNMAMAQVVFQGHLASGRIWQSHGESTQGVRVIGASWRPKLAQWKCVNQMVSLLNQIWDFCIRVQGSILICAASFGNLGNSLLVHLEHDESVSKWRDTLKSIVSYQQLAFPADLGDPKILRHPNHWLNIEAPDTLRGVLHSNRAWSSEKLWL